MPDTVVERGAAEERLERLEAENRRLLGRLSSTAEEAARSAERARLHAAYASALRQLLAQSQAHVEALTASTSWRLTRPLRAVIEPMRRMFSGRRQVRPPPRPELPSVPLRRRRGPPSGFPLPRDVAAHPALLAEPQPSLSVTVSVVIPTWNAGRELYWLLCKLRAQRGVGGVQIIVVDSGSTDGTAELAARLGCVVVPIAQADFSHSAARNLGASVATGELLLFMVQDAYPIGDEWLAGLARCLLHPAREEDRLAALSCAEFSRADSELIYDAMARTHYEFLGCADADRVGRLTTHDQEGLRRQGQLSDVACLIPRALFERFLFHGRYAEDLTLGVRLIEAGHQLGMLSSIRVAHAHNRPASYYVRRVFVDVVFLAGVFSDFTYPPGQDAVGAVIASFALAQAMPVFTAEPGGVPDEILRRVIDAVRRATLPQTGSAAPADGDFGFRPLGDWMARLLRERAVVGRALSPAERRGGEMLRDMAVARLDALRPFVSQAWPVADEAALAELRAAVDKTLAMSLGAQLAYCHLADAAGGASDPMLVELKPMLLAGI